MGYKPVGFRSGRKVVGVRVACHKTSRQRHTFLLTLGADLCETMGWKNGSRAEIAIGNGKEVGWLRLKTDEDGYTLFKTGKNALALNAALAELADDQPHSRERAEYKIKGGELYVRLPKWARV